MKKSPVFCEHANEVPNKCNCKSSCYCKKHSCRAKVVNGIVSNIAQELAVEDLVAMVVLTFCENLAELGCPKEEKDADMWYRYLAPKQQRKVASKMIDIIVGQQRMERLIKRARR